MTIRKSKQRDSASVAQSGDETAAPLERVRDHSLPDDVLPLIDAYEDVVGDRDRFLWKWAHHLFPEFRLSSVGQEHEQQAQDTKLLGLLFVSVLDDVAEKHQDWATFDEAAKLPFEHHTVNMDRADVDRDALAFATAVWNQFWTGFTEGPRADEFEDLVRFDLKQVVNAMEYSYLVNQNLDAVTLSEVQTYDAHNMMLYGFADVDLVHSPSFERSDLSVLRRVVERAQQMVRIGNWITTWEREVTEGDFTSGIIAHALEHDVVSVDDLRASRAAGSESGTIIRTIRDHDVEDVFRRQWSEELAAAREFEGSLDSVDVGPYLDGIESVMEYHLVSRGLK